MRYKYMYGGMYGREFRAPQPWEYVGWFGEWIGYSIDALFNQGSAAWLGRHSFVNRPGLIHLLSDGAGKNAESGSLSEGGHIRDQFPS